MSRILVVDDEPDIRSLLEYNLKKAGYRVSSAADGEDALSILRTGNIDLIILDLMLPGLNGLEICQIIRQNPKMRDIPVIMLTARGEEEDRVRGLETGADDYLTKPFSPRELMARVKAVLRRSLERGSAHGLITLGELSINKDTVEVRKKDRLLQLSATEFRLLTYLAERKGRVFSREQLLDAVWEDDRAVEPRTVDVHIRRLRMEIEDDPAQPSYVKTRRGTGYYVDSGDDSRTK
ncbi:MAG: response regulator [Nitrospirota bacterium]|nr:response regulator [Nitrospirota bacterium]